MRPQIFEQKKSQHHYATYKKNGLTFEILIKPMEAMEYKKGSNTDIASVLEFEGIFSDARAGERAANLVENFGTDNITDIAHEILIKGTIQLTTEYKRTLIEQKKREVIDFICRNGIDARTKMPIPPTRVELALDQVAINFDPFKSAKEQIEMVLEKIRSSIPISFEEKKVSVTVGSKYAGKISSILTKYGKISKTAWNNDGSCTYELFIPGGMQDELIKKVNDFSHGEANINF